MQGLLLRDSFGELVRPYQKCSISTASPSGEYKRLSYKYRCVENRHQPLHYQRGTPTLPRERNFLPTIEVGRPGEDGAEEDLYAWRSNEYYRSMTSLVLERSNKNSQTWSILGDHYNKDFRRRMETRQSRRDHVGNVDRKLTNGGGLGNTCFPFQALHMPDTKEYELPKNMPMTSRMMHKAGRSLSEPVWMAVRQGALPPLPALKRSDSFLTMAESASGNALQVSFMVE